MNTVKVIDGGYSKTIKALLEPQPFLDVGITDESGAVVHPRSGKTISEIATINEYGTEANVPSRPFLRTWFDSNRDKLIAQLAGAYQLEFRKGGVNRSSSLRALERAGGRFRNQLKQTITNNDMEPRNAPFTIRRKGFDWPLVETGRLVKAIVYRIASK